MTAKEIEAARGWIRNALLLSELPTIDKAWAALDALCAAAIEDSLVGKRTPEIKPNFTPVKLEALVVCTDCGAVHAADCRCNTLDRNGPQTGACPVCGNPSIRPLDFEVLEGDDAE